MKKIKFFLFFLLFNYEFLFGLGEIKNICIDISLLFYTNKYSAIKYISIFDSIEYIAKKRKEISQKSFFEALYDIPAETIFTTFNLGLKMPFIMVEWLIGNRSNKKLFKIIKKHILDNNNLMQCEKNIFIDTTKMILTPDYLVDTQKKNEVGVNFVKELEKMQKYNIIFSGNWPEDFFITKKFAAIFKDKNYYFSNKLKTVKPDFNFYYKILKFENIDSEETLFIETESYFGEILEASNFNFVLFEAGENFYKKLKNFGIDCYKQH